MSKGGTIVNEAVVPLFILNINMSKNLVKK